MIRRRCLIMLWVLGISVIESRAEFPVSVGPGWHWSPRAAFDGSKYLVIWQDSDGVNPLQIYGSRLTKNGAVLDTFLIYTFSTITTDSSGLNWLAFGDSTYFIVVTDAYDLFGIRVSPEGVVDSIPIPLDTTCHNFLLGCGGGFVSFDGSNFLVVLDKEDENIYGMRVSSEGVVLDPVGFPVCTDTAYQGGSSSASSGDNSLVVWMDSRDGSNGSNIYGTFVSPLGYSLDTFGFPISPIAYRHEFPRVTFDGTNYLVVWDFEPSVFPHFLQGTRVTPTGIVLDSPPIFIDTSEFYLNPWVVLGESSSLVTWLHFRYSPREVDIYGGRVTPDGVVMDIPPLPITADTSSETDGGVYAFDGCNWLVLWTELNADYDIYGEFVDGCGPRIITAVASDGTNPAPEIDDDDFVTITFHERSNAPFLDASNINTVLQLFGGHSWLDGSGGLGNAQWNSTGDTLVIFLSIGDSPPTVAVGDTIFPDRITILDTLRNPSIRAGVITGSFGPVGTKEDMDQSSNVSYKLLQNRPNPFFSSGKSTVIRYDLAKPGEVSLKIYDIAGRLMRTLEKGEKKAGMYSISWNGEDLEGKEVSSGIYFYRLSASDPALSEVEVYTSTRKMILFR